MAMSCEVGEAPRFIRYTVTGEWPSIDEHAALRRSLIEQGQLTADTHALFDIRMVASTPSYSEVKNIVSAAMKAGGLPLRHG